MNNSHNPKKILVNGCSHTKAHIPDLPEINESAFSWPKLLSDKMECEVVNLATVGKDNFIILEEAQRYLLNYSDVDHVVIQLTEWHRWALYKKNQSFRFIPGEPETQFDRLSFAKNNFYIKIPGITHEDCKVTVTETSGLLKTRQIGDSSFFYERLTCATMLFNLYYYCLNNNIGITVLPYDSMGENDEPNDAVYQKIPKSIFLQKNYEIGLWDYLILDHEAIGGHFVSSAHTFITDLVYNHILNGTQTYIDPEKIKRRAVQEIIYDYTT